MDKELKKHIDKSLEIIAVTRRLIVLDGTSTEEIDEFIRTRGTEYIEKVKDMSIDQLLTMLFFKAINEINLRGK